MALNPRWGACLAQGGRVESAIPGQGDLCAQDWSSSCVFWLLICYCCDRTKVMVTNHRQRVSSRNKMVPTTDLLWQAN